MRHHWATHELLSSRQKLFLDARMHSLTMDETLSLVREAIEKRIPFHHTALNVAKLVHMQTNAELQRDVSQADIVSVDGVGVVWGARLCGIEMSERVTGVDLMEKTFALCAERGYRPYLLGAEAWVLQRVIERLGHEYPQLELAGSQDGYFDPSQENAIVEKINASGADCLFVAMPTPRKERFLYKFRDQFTVPFIMGVGGSFDVYGGKVKRAPTYVQRVGLEWLYRVGQEPGRLWRRYYETNTRFAGLLVRELIRRRTQRPPAVQSSEVKL